jgi:aldehyde dehydrogenase (NAD+)
MEDLGALPGAPDGYTSSDSKSTLHHWFALARVACRPVHRGRVHYPAMLRHLRAAPEGIPDSPTASPPGRFAAPRHHPLPHRVMSAIIPRTATCRRLDDEETRMDPTAADLPRYGLYIDGCWTEAADGGLMDVNEPARGAPMAQVAAATPADVDRAVAAARAAFDNGPWPHTAPHERARILHAIADLIAQHADEFAELDARNLGAPLRKIMFVDLPGVQDHFHTFAELARRSPYEPAPWTDMPGVSWNFIWREPIGVCGQIVPWNFPLLFAAWKLAPALATGNCVVFKPAPETPLSALRLAGLIHESGLLPRGVLNIITGPGAEIGEALVAHPQVDKISFTGSTRTGRRVMELAAGTVKRLALELGGKSPALILPDADLALATDGVLFGVYMNAGQACEAGTRCFVPERLHDELVDRLVRRAAALRLGDPLDLQTDIGPLVSEKQRRIVEEYIAVGKAEGARLALGGERPEVPGFERAPFVAPTIFTDARNDMRIAQEEIFGPVLTVIPYRDVSEAIQLANRSAYGLAAAVWSGDLQQAIEVARRIRCGTVWINDHHLILPHTSFTGVKQSGFGNEHGLPGYLEYTVPKHIHVDLMRRRDGRLWWDAVLPPAEG